MRKKSNPEAKLVGNLMMIVIILIIVIIHIVMVMAEVPWAPSGILPPGAKLAYLDSPSSGLEQRIS